MDVDLGMLIGNGEETKLEYKKTLIWSEKAVRAEMVRDLLAMVNAHETGTGYLLIGVDDETHKLFDAASLALDDGALHTFVNEYTDPPVPFSFVYRQHEGITLGVIEVLPSPDRFHFVKKDLHGSDKPLLNQGETWIRSGATRRRLSAWDMKRLKEDYAKQFEAPQPNLVVTFANKATEIPQHIMMMPHRLSAPSRIAMAPEMIGYIDTKFFIHNQGSQGAENIHVTIYLPSGCSTGRPRDPFDPNFLTDFGTRLNRGSWILTERDESVDISGPSLIHGLVQGAEETFVKFKDPTQTYELRWSARAANMVKPTSGILTVVPRAETR